ncbi:aminotransferase class I/II-fold pyridoxal phosphate-dependent enzyme [Nodularia sphaerocarpa]|uniref:aminotransferase class I/II-fold pyridoxal phosphate-dependent enzyme n=1 Tax=Nodularia sphaerocarpa TaxID=137816 RepID=UPI001EFBFEA8|nr:aminotransferase class I/II-fold pyridoxal phosphate-dependent enzyme [Nodularia sphaerocarpa]MDB9375008.1 DegT/DnrJ/EryC1/StrS family aminotransferase [Nodularia sphaerocarpa CS-585]MDB9377687.1 DegT/DnrJ/EryC1/StrS family aminotransferase [Nodularia sphaerocarpa CS-585A2]ULP74198.1 dTDP-4-amino-4,6-dideoxy-D-glucose transaminase [Nodularia sphaerocarpa UHCC 0038]
MLKTQLEDLAIFGADPAFAEKLHVGRPNIGDRDLFLKHVNTILDNRWLSNNGPFVQQLEQELAKFLGVKHCIPTCNGTVALEIAIRACGLKGEVIVPSFTFIATPHALQWQEITPVFCDIDPETHLIDPEKVEALITPRTTGILAVHLWGQPCNVEALTGIAKRHNLKLLFDASHAFACSYDDQMIGGFGNAEVFSFHATKFFNTLEGGAIATNDDELAAKIRLMKNFGFSGYENVIYIGTNGKMNEVSAAMGLTSLKNMAQTIEINQRNYHLYKQGLEGISALRFLAYVESEKFNYQYIVCELNTDITQFSRDQFIEILWAENILARRYFHPGCHRMEPYRSYFPHAGLLLPHTERVTDRVFLLPTGQTINPLMIEEICELINLILTNSQDIISKLKHSGHVNSYFINSLSQFYSNRI